MPRLALDRRRAQRTAHGVASYFPTCDEELSVWPHDPKGPTLQEKSERKLNMESNVQINEALGLLEDVATNSRQELKTLISDKYASLKSAIIENEQSLLGRLAEAKNFTVDQSREIAQNLDRHVRKNPWLYVGGMAAAGLLLGYLAARRHD